MLGSGRELMELNRDIGVVEKIYLLQGTLYPLFSREILGLGWMMLCPCKHKKKLAYAELSKW